MSFLTKEQLERLALHRLADARALVAASQWSGAYYVAGYAAEIGLKAVIAKQFRADTIPDKNLVNGVYTHDILALVRYAGLTGDLDAEIQRDRQFAIHWESVKRWREDARHRIWPKEDAESLCLALSDDQSGVFRWIRVHW